MTHRAQIQIDIRPTTLADVPSVVQLMHAAYTEYEGKLDPPSGAHKESVESIAAKLQTASGALAWIGPTLAGSVLYEVQGTALYMSRLAVLPAYRRCGIGPMLPWACGLLCPKSCCFTSGLAIQSSVQEAIPATMYLRLTRCRSVCCRNRRPHLLPATHHERKAHGDSTME